MYGESAGCKAIAQILPGSQTFPKFVAMKRLLCLLTACLLSLTVSAQVTIKHTSDSLANQLVERHKKVNAAKMSMTGFRVQLYFGSERQKANEIRTDFLSQYSGTGAYLLYQQPYFKVRVGDFRTRLEAQAFLKKISTVYTSAFIVTDEVKLPSLD